MSFKVHLGLPVGQYHSLTLHKLADFHENPYGHGNVGWCVVLSIPAILVALTDPQVRFSVINWTPMFLQFKFLTICLKPACNVINSPF